MKKIFKYRESLYDSAVARTLYFYENWILPCPKESGFHRQTRISLHEAKMIEFKEKKKLLNPYDKELLLDSANQEERLRLEDVSKRTSFNNVHTDKLRYDRHKGAYGLRITNFPDSYHIRDSALEWRMDPDGGL